MKYLAILLVLIYSFTFSNAQLNCNNFTIIVSDCDQQTVQINDCVPFCAEQVHAKIYSLNGMGSSYAMEYYVDPNCNRPMYNGNNQLMKFPFICIADGQKSPVDVYGDYVVCHEDDAQNYF